MKRIGSYTNGTYKVDIYEDGTKVRSSKSGIFIPNFPECIDMTITEYCDNGCKYCYAGCSTNGRSCDFNKYKKLFDSIHPYTEIAINGNDLSNPELNYFLQSMKDRKVIVNMTVNQIHFMKYVDYLHSLIDNGLIIGLGISLVNPTDEFIEEVSKFNNAVIHIVNGITTIDQLSMLFDKNLKILILGYKNIGRGSDYLKDNEDKVRYNCLVFKNNLYDIISRFNVVSFDNLALRQLDVKKQSRMSDYEWSEFYMGDDAEFTFFINLVKGCYSKNSLSNWSYNIGDKTVEECFNKIRKRVDKAS